MKNGKKRFALVLAISLLSLSLLLSGCDEFLDSLLSDGSSFIPEVVTTTAETTTTAEDVLSETFETTTTSKATTLATTTKKTQTSAGVPAYSGKPYVALNNNEPAFTQGDMTTTGFETYATLDYLGRCGVAFACLCTDLMPTGKRGSISSIHPSGWKQQMYDFVDGRAVYNRCHLIGWQLSGENANERNLITGTRYLNTKGMLPFENMVSDYIKETHNHVLYRITPIFDGDNLVASGVQMEAYSVEDDGDGICFNVYCYNVQPGVWIDYKTGENHAEDTVTEAPKTTAKKTTLAPVDTKDATYVGNRNTKKFHKPSCASVKQMKESNRVFFYCQREEVVSQGYVPCKNCNP